MALIVKVLGISLLTSALGAGLAFALFGQSPDYGIAVLAFGCIGAVVGAIAGAALEVVTALRQRSVG